MQRVKKGLGILLVAAMLLTAGVPAALAEEDAYTNDFSSNAALNDFNAVGGTMEIQDGKLKVDGAGNAAAVLKTKTYKNFTLEVDLSLEGREQIGVWFRIGNAENIEAGSYNVSFQFDVGGDKTNDKIQCAYFPWNDNWVDWVNFLNVADKDQSGKTGTIKLKLVVIGGAVSVYTDGVYRSTHYAYNQRNEIVDGQPTDPIPVQKYEEGYIGLGGWNFTGLFDNLKVTPLADDAAPVGVFDLDEEPLHAFDFSEALGNKWIVSDPEKITVADGKLKFDGTEGDQYALFNTPIEEEAYCVEVKFVHTAGNIGLVSRAVAAGDDPAANPFKAMAYTFEGGLVKLTEYPYKEFVLTKPFEVLPGSENVLRIYVNGNTTDVFVNGAHVLGYNGGSATGKLIGLLGWNAQCTFDDLKVYKVKGEAPPPPPTPSTPAGSSDTTDSPKTGPTAVLPLILALTALSAAAAVLAGKKARGA